MKLKTFKMVSSLFGLAQIVKIKVTEEPRNEVSRKLCCFLELSFCSCKECWYIQNWKKDGGRPMFKYKTTKMIQGALIPFWWSGSRLVISSSWGDPGVIVGSFWKSLLLFRTPDATHHPLVSEDVITRNKAQQRSQQRVAQRGLILLFPLIHLNLSDPASLILIWNIPKEMQPKSNIQNSNTGEQKLWGWCQWWECSYYRYRDFKMFGVFGTKGTVCYIIREV